MEKFKNKNIDAKRLIEIIRKPKPKNCGECNFCVIYNSIGKAYCNYYSRETQITNPYCFTDYNNK